MAILKIAVPVPLYRLFDYLAPADVEPGQLQPGMRIVVPFGKGKVIAWLVDVVFDTDYPLDKLKAAERLVDDVSLLSATDIRLLRWAGDYYCHPPGEVFATAFPAELRKGRMQAGSKEERYFGLTEAGAALAVEALKRSVKQHELWQGLHRIWPQPLSAADFARDYRNWRAPLKALIDKGLVDEIRQRIETRSHCVPSALPDADVLRQRQMHTLNDEQTAAVNAVCEGLDKFSVYLLEGITGSGKTEVYMRIIQEVLAQGRQVLVLIPEINLTPQLESRFRQRFPVALAVSHSNLTDKQRCEAWLNVQRGQSAILLGTRSALFTPMAQPGLIILDEEHDSSFKQQEGFRFSARDVAVMRAKLLNIPVILGSATPSLESLRNAEQQRYQHLILSKRAGNAVDPKIFIVDIRNKKLHAGLSEALIEEIKKVVEKGEQALLFLNRRGYAPTLICHGCGWVARCRHCDANLVLHSAAGQLRCHHCGHEQALSAACPACGGNELVSLGLGTEQVESVMAQLFPNKKIVRLDRDTTQRKGALENYLAQINSGRADIILGTQMLAKGHHFGNVTLVAIIDIDSGLYSIDYRANERLAQLVVQVSGRAGRAEKTGIVILQTRKPEHPLLTTLIQEGYARVARMMLEERQQAMLPPFSSHALLRAQSNRPGRAFAFLKQVSAQLKLDGQGRTMILGPVPAPMEKRAGVFRYHLLLQNPRRPELQKSLGVLLDIIENSAEAKKLRWSLDIDPVDWL